MLLRAEDVHIALVMPSSPVVVDVDAIAADPGYSVLGARRGLLVIHGWAITWTSDLRVASVLPGLAQVLHTEA